MNGLITALIFVILILGVTLWANRTKYAEGFKAGMFHGWHEGWPEGWQAGYKASGPHYGDFVAQLDPDINN